MVWNCESAAKTEVEFVELRSDTLKTAQRMLENSEYGTCME